MDNGAQQCLFGTKDWLILNRHNKWIVADGPVSTQASESLRLVDAQTTLLDSSGEAIAIAQVNQGMYCATSVQTLLAKDQLEYNGV